MLPALEVLPLEILLEMLPRARARVEADLAPHRAIRLARRSSGPLPLGLGLGLGLLLLRPVLARALSAVLCLALCLLPSLLAALSLVSSPLGPRLRKERLRTVRLSWGAAGSLGSTPTSTAASTAVSTSPGGRTPAPTATPTPTPTPGECEGECEGE